MLRCEQSSPHTPQDQSPRNSKIGEWGHRSPQKMDSQLNLSFWFRGAQMLCGGCNRRKRLRTRKPSLSKRTSLSSNVIFFFKKNRFLSFWVFSSERKSTSIASRWWKLLISKSMRMGRKEVTPGITSNGVFSENGRDCTASSLSICIDSFIGIHGRKVIAKGAVRGQKKPPKRRIYLQVALPSSLPFRSSSSDIIQSQSSSMKLNGQCPMNDIWMPSEASCRFFRKQESCWRINFKKKLSDWGLLSRIRVNRLTRNSLSWGSWFKVSFVLLIEEKEESEK